MKALPITALVLAVLGPVTIVLFAIVGAVLTGLGYVMGMPDADEAVVQAVLRFAQIGAGFALVLLVVAVILAAVASTRAVRSRRLVIAAWIAIGVSGFFTAMTLLAPALF